MPHYRGGISQSPQIVFWPRIQLDEYPDELIFSALLDTAAREVDQKPWIPKVDRSVRHCFEIFPLKFTILWAPDGEAVSLPQLL